MENRVIGKIQFRPARCARRAFLKRALRWFSVCKIVAKAWHYSPYRSTTQIVCKIDSNRNNSLQRLF
jgi:hypothetical protein